VNVSQLGGKVRRRAGAVRRRAQPSKQLDTAWQGSAMQLYGRVRRIVSESFGYDPFLMYGTLLGAVRDGTFIGHDPDFDAAYVSRCTNGPDAAAELVQIALTLVEQGLSCDLRARVLHIFDPKDNNLHIDLFHTYFEGRLHRFPFGVAGTSTLHEHDWAGTEEIDFAGGRALVPRNAVQLVAHLYGEDWRLPKPGFNWHLERTDQAAEGQLTDEQRTKVYWADFYAHTEYTSGSAFYEFVNARPEMPDTVIDIGCGDGRDSCAFGSAGRTVLGLDQSPVGIRHAADHAARSGVSDRVRFRVCDVADVDDLGYALDEVVDVSSGPVLFYLRFFLHAITADVQVRLLDALVVHSRPGDLFAAEFRTDKDKANTHVHGKHYRRFQNADEFRESLTKRFASEVLFEVEDTGLSPYGDEDPVLYRVIARRT